jgi:hypothetical protein
LFGVTTFGLYSWERPEELLDQQLVAINVLSRCKPYGCKTCTYQKPLLRNNTTVPHGNCLPLEAVVKVCIYMDLIHWRHRLTHAFLKFCWATFVINQYKRPIFKISQHFSQRVALVECWSFSKKTLNLKIWLQAIPTAHRVSLLLMRINLGYVRSFLRDESKRSCMVGGPVGWWDS